MGRNIRSIERNPNRVDAGGMPITGNGFGSGFAACELPMSVEKGTYPATLRRFAESDEPAMSRELRNAESAARVATGMKRAIAQLWPHNSEVHVKREGKVVYVYKMMMGDGL